MVDRSEILQLRQILVLREAQTVAAAEDARQAQAERDSASAARDLSAKGRDTADEHWLHLLGQSRPDPQLVRLGGAWLLERQRELENRELDLAIAGSRSDKARQDHAQALGREGAVRKIGSRARKALDHQLEERQSAQLSDTLLWRRAR